MKIIYRTLFVAAALIATLSCNKEMTSGVDSVDPGVNPSPAVITFGTKGVMDLASKAISTSDTSSLKTSGFKAAGIVDGSTPSVLFNEDCAYSSTKKLYETSKKTYYFPSTGTMDFFAVHPSKTLSVSGSTVTVADYVASGTEDLIVAETDNVSKQSSSVSLSFDHILSGLTVNAYGVDTAVVYEITAVEIIYNNKGTYTFPGSSSVKDGSWTLDSTSPTNTYTSSTVTSVSTASATPTGLLSETSVLPGTVNIKLSWKTYSTDASKTLYGEYTDISGAPQTITIGKKTEITCKLANNKADGITFVVTVADWGSDSKTVDFEG